MQFVFCTRNVSPVKFKMKVNVTGIY